MKDPNDPIYRCTGHEKPKSGCPFTQEFMKENCQLFPESSKARLMALEFFREFKGRMIAIHEALQAEYSADDEDTRRRRFFAMMVSLATTTQLEIVSLLFVMQGRQTPPGNAGLGIIAMMSLIATHDLYHLIEKFNEYHDLAANGGIEQVFDKAMEKVKKQAEHPIPPGTRLPTGFDATPPNNVR